MLSLKPRCVHGSPRSILPLPAFLPLWLLCLSCGWAPSTPRHVLMISLDTTRADQLGFYGNEKVKTPRLDELARDSVVLTDCMTVVPTTLASHTSLMTGKYTHHHGIPRNGFVVHQDNEMLAEVLQRAGFNTVGFAAAFPLSDRFHFAQGFDYYEETFDVESEARSTVRFQSSAATVTDAVIDYFNSHDLPDRLYLFVHYFDPHQPYLAPEPFETMYDSKGRQARRTPRVLLQSKLPPVKKRRLLQEQTLQYAAEISYMDHHVGRLLDDLRDRGLLDQAMVVVTSDHGETLLGREEEVFKHGFAVYQDTIRSVCVFRLPNGEHGGTRIRQPVASIDVMPTILDRLGLEIPAAVDGAPIPFGEPVEPRVRFGEAAQPRYVEGRGWRNRRKARYVREGRYKLIRTPYLRSERLYDLEADPLERSNLLDDPTPEIEAIADGLRRKLEQWDASAKPLKSRFEREKRADTKKKLRSLGYL